MKSVNYQIYGHKTRNIDIDMKCRPVSLKVCNLVNLEVTLMLPELRGVAAMKMHIWAVLLKRLLGVV